MKIIKYVVFTVFTDYFSQVLDEHGSIDILLNNVGGRLIDILREELPLVQWQKIIGSNLLMLRYQWEIW